MTIAHPNALAGVTTEAGPSLTGVRVLLDADPFHLVP